MSEGKPMPVSTARRAPVMALVWLLRIAALWAFCFHLVYLPLASHGVDYPKHWDSAVDLLEGRSPYAANQEHGFNYPLFSVFFYTPLVFFERGEGEIPWDIANILQILATIFVIGRWLRPASRGETPVGGGGKPAVQRFLAEHWWTIVAFCVVSYQPLQRVMIAGNVDPLNMLLSAVFAAFVYTNRNRLAGASLAVFALIKLAPVFLAIPLFATRRWRALAFFGAGIASYLMFLGVSGYWRTEIYLYTDIIPRIPFVWRGISCSLHHLVATLGPGPWLEEERLFSRVVFLTNAALMLAYAGLIGLWYRRKNRSDLALLVLGYVMTIAFTPLLEINHFVWILPAFFLMLILWVRNELPDAAFCVCIVGWMGIFAMETITNLYFKVKPPIPEFYPRTFVLIYNVVASGWLALAARTQDAEARPSG